jgi:hypothetical protein
VPSLRIIHISWDPLSAAPYRLVQVQRLCGLEAHLISEPRSYGNRIYPHDLAIDGDRELLADLLAAADVVHYHNWWKEGELFKRHPWAWELVRRKPSVIQFHSPRAPWYEAQLREPSLTKLVVAQYQVRQYPECLPVPNAVPIDDPLHRPLFLDNDPPVVAYTPPICDGEGWYDKGYEATVSVLERGFAHRTVTDAPWAEVMAIRQRCDVAIDEVVTGSYHMCSLEALSQGLATVANLDAQTVDALERVTGTRRHPWVIASPATLEAVLARLVAEPAYRAACRQAARSYMERHWSPRTVADRFAEIYRASRERHGS